MTNNTDQSDHVERDEICISCGKPGELYCNDCRTAHHRIAVEEDKEAAKDGNKPTSPDAKPCPYCESYCQGDCST